MKMNQILKFSACRRSLLTGNRFTRRSSKPISSSPLISNNPTSSKFHHTFNYPPPRIFSTLGNQFRKFTGEPAAAECRFDNAYVKREISEVYDAIMDAQGDIELGYVPPLEAAKILEDKFNALIEKLGLDKEKSEDYPEKIESLKEAVDETVAFGKFAACDKNRELDYIWGGFKKWYHDAGGKFEGETSESINGSDTLPTAQQQIATPVDDDASSAVVAGNKADIAAAKFNSDDNYLDKEINGVWDALLAAQKNIELGILPPLDAVKVTVDKFKAIMEIVGLDYEDEGDDDDIPEHQKFMRQMIYGLQDHVQETVAFARYVAAGKNIGPPCFDNFLDYDAVAACKFWEESSELQNESDTLPTAAHQVAVPVDDALNTYQELNAEKLTLPAFDLAAEFTHPNKAVMEILSDFVEENRGLATYHYHLWNLLTSARLKDLGVGYNQIPIPDKQKWRASWLEEGKPNWLGAIPTHADGKLYYTASIAGYVEKNGGKGGYGVIFFDNYGRPKVASVGVSLKGNVPLIYYEFQGLRSALQLALGHSFGGEVKLYCDSDTVCNILDLCLQHRSCTPWCMGKPAPCAGLDLFGYRVMQNFDLLIPVIKEISDLFPKINTSTNVKVTNCCGSGHLAKWFSTSITEDVKNQFGLLVDELGLYEMAMKPDVFPQEVDDTVYDEVFKGDRVHSELIMVEKVSEASEYTHPEALFRKLKKHCTLKMLSGV